MRLINLLLFLLSFQVLIGQNIIPPKDVKLSQEEIENKTISELWLMRNSIFAKHGRTFKTYELHTIFMKQSWYKPDENFSQSRLSSNDLYNIDLLYKQEQKLRENDFLTVKGKKSVNIDNIFNIFQYPEFNSVEKEKLTENGFVVLPTNRNQLFHIYERNDYIGVPSFITVDAVLQLYHLYFDMTLRTIESKYLLAKLNNLVDQTIVELELLKGQTLNMDVIHAIDFNLAYLAVPQYFLKDGKVDIKGSLKTIAEQEIENCKNHVSWTQSPLFGRMMDYSQYIPRGHYTRSDDLKKFFLAMMWIGNAGIDVTTDNGALSSVILADIIKNKSFNNKPLKNIWEDIYEPTVFYVGLADDTGPNELNSAISDVFPTEKSIDKYADKQKLRMIVDQLPDPKISGHGTWGKQNKQFRIMGQRFIPDSYVFYRLTNTDRKMPNSLDIMAAFGNNKAYDLMVNEYTSSWENFPNYQLILNELTSENNKRSQAEWKQNLYYHWIYNLNSLYDIKNRETLPFFMTTDGWDVKTLNTTLASWSELRHNTILYAKQSYAAECGGEGNEVRAWIPEPPKGYVEPNVEFYDRMLSLMNLTIDGLEQRNMLEKRVKYIGSEFIDLLVFLKNISNKELSKTKLSLEEYDQIQRIGSLLDNLTLRVLTDGYQGWDELDGPDKNMPVIADVHTADATVLEVGVGKAHEIYVVVEIEGKLKLTRGAIFSYYEFPWPMSDRLTDEKWQEMLNNNKAPDQPKWINYKSNQNYQKRLYPLYKPEILDIPDSSTEPGWKTIYYDTGC